MLFRSASVCASVLPLHPYAFAMASGIGSASMNAAAISPLVYMYPNMANTLLAFAGFSNLLSFCFGIYASIFLGIPLTEYLYKHLEPIIGRNVPDVLSSISLSSKDTPNTESSEEKSIGND